MSENSENENLEDFLKQNIKQQDKNITEHAVRLSYLENHKENFEQKVSKRLEEFKKTEVRWKKVQGVIASLCIAYIIFLGYWLKEISKDTEHRMTKLETNLKIQSENSSYYKNIIKETEHRLTELETQFEICVKCKDKNNNEKYFGGYKWKISKGFDLDENDNINLGIEIDILTEQYRWECGSIDKIIRGGEKVDFDEIIKGYSVNKHLNSVKGLICIGASSSEGKIDGEESRAEDRMETLINKLEDNLAVDTIPIWGLNIGQYVNGTKEKKCSDETLLQRRVVIIKVIEQKEGISQKEFVNAVVRVLLDKMRSEEGFPIDIRDYSKYKNRELKLRFGRGK